MEEAVMFPDVSGWRRRRAWDQRAGWTADLEVAGSLRPVGAEPADRAAVAHSSEARASDGDRSAHR